MRKLVLNLSIFTCILCCKNNISYDSKIDIDIIKAVIKHEEDLPLNSLILFKNNNRYNICNSYNDSLQSLVQSRKEDITPFIENDINIKYKLHYKKQVELDSNEFNLLDKSVLQSDKRMTMIAFSKPIPLKDTSYYIVEVDFLGWGIAHGETFILKKDLSQAWVVFKKFKRWSS
jgi:hypothetical protein